MNAHVCNAWSKSQPKLTQFSFVHVLDAESDVSENVGTYKTPMNVCIFHLLPQQADVSNIFALQRNCFLLRRAEASEVRFFLKLISC